MENRDNGWSVVATVFGGLRCGMDDATAAAATAEDNSQEMTRDRELIADARL